MKNSRRADLDILRSLAMLWILGAHHIDDYVGNPWHAITDLPTQVGLVGFALVSGYLFAASCASRRPLAVLGSRMLRLYPPFALALVAQVLLRVSEPGHLVPGLLLLSPALGVNIITLWFVPTILYCHGLGCVLIRLEPRWQRILLACAVVLIIALLGDMTPWIEQRLGPLLIGYCVGMELRRYPTADAWLGGMSSIAALALAGALCLVGSNAPLDLGTIQTPLLYLTLTFGALTALAAIRWLTERFSWLRLDRLSTASYFAYLSHRSAFRIVYLFYYTFFDFHFLLLLFTLYVTLILCVFPASYLAQRWYNALLARFRSRDQQPA